MRIRIATYVKYDHHHPYKESSGTILSMKDGMLLVGDIPFDLVVDAEEMLSALEALIKWHQRGQQHSEEVT